MKGGLLFILGYETYLQFEFFRKSIHVKNNGTYNSCIFTVDFVPSSQVSKVTFDLVIPNLENLNIKSPFELKSTSKDSWSTYSKTFENEDIKNIHEVLSIEY